MKTPGISVGAYSPDFELRGIDDQVHHLARYLENHQVITVVFLSNTCSYVRLYIDRLKEIQQAFEPQGCTLIGINANDLESCEEMKSFAREYQLNFPYLKDFSQDVLSSFGATITPEVFLLDNQGILRYKGTIDNNPNSSELGENAYLWNNITALLNQETISPDSTQPVGSPIQGRK